MVCAPRVPGLVHKSVKQKKEPTFLQYRLNKIVRQHIHVYLRSVRLEIQDYTSIYIPCL